MTLAGVEVKQSEHEAFDLFSWFSVLREQERCAMLIHCPPKGVRAVMIVKDSNETNSTNGGAPTSNQHVKQHEVFHTKTGRSLKIVRAYQASMWEVETQFASPANQAFASDVVIMQAALNTLTQYSTDGGAVLINAFDTL